MRAGSRMSLLQLPAESLDRIFRLLPLDNLALLMLVCTRFRQVGENVPGWARLCLTVGEGNRKCLAIHRLRKMRAVRLSSVTDEVLSAVLLHPALKELTVDKNLALASADPCLLGQVVARMETVNLAKVPDKRLRSFYYSQQKVFFGRVSESSSLKSLNINNRSLTSVEPNLLVNVVLKLESANLKDTELTEEQTSQLFLALGNGARLRHLAVSSNMLSGVLPAHMAAAVEKLTFLNLAYTQLTRPQTVALFDQLNRGDHLAHLIIGLNDLSAVSPRVLAASLSKLTTLELREVGLTLDQWTQIFSTIGTATNLQEADFSKNNLSKVNHTLLAAAILNLKTVKMMSTRLTAAQSSNLINSICYTPSKLTDITLMFNNFSKVSPVYLAIAASKLDKLDMGWTKLRPEQLEAIFQRLSQEEVQLTELKLSGVHLGQVSPRYLAESVNKLRLADLNFTHLEPAQLRALFGVMEEGTRLREINLSSNSLEGIPARTVAEAIRGLERVNLSETNLSLRQAEIILRQQKWSNWKFMDLRKNLIDSLELYTEMKNSTNILV